MQWDEVLEQRLFRRMPSSDWIGQSRITFPAKGDRIRVVLRRDQQSWQDNKLVTIPAGTTYEGTVSQVDTNGFFEIVDNAGECIKCYLGDSALRIEVTAAVRSSPAYNIVGSTSA
jgi:hypothetical protein